MKKICRMFWENRGGNVFICNTGHVMNHFAPIKLDLHPVASTEPDWDKLDKLAKIFYCRLGKILGLDDDLILNQWSFNVTLVRGLNWHDDVEPQILAALLHSYRFTEFRYMSFPPNQKILGTTHHKQY